MIRDIFVYAGAMICILVGFFLGSMAQAQVSSPYVDFSTNLDGQNTVTLGGEIQGFGVSTFVEGSRIGSFDESDWELELGADVDLSVIETTVSTKYVWGDTNGKNLIGHEREWGDVYASIEGRLATGIAGGEYAFVNTDILIEEYLDIEYTGVDVGAGYKLELGDRAYVDGRIIWNIDRDWNVSREGVGVSVGFKF